MLNEKFSYPLTQITEIVLPTQATEKYGWHNKSVGFECLTENRTSMWGKITEHANVSAAHGFIERLVAANQIKGVNKPFIGKNSIIQNESGVWTFILMDYVASPSVSPNQYGLNTNKSLSKEFFEKLKHQLDSLSVNKSDYIAFRQDLVNRRIQERAPRPINTEITEWCTVHGDLHWSNLTLNTTILDWESWGIGPRGIDLAFLYAFSLPNDELKKAINKSFAEEFSLHQFKICLLFACSELLRMIMIHNDHPILYDYLIKLEKEIHEELAF